MQVSHCLRQAAQHQYCTHRLADDCLLYTSTFMQERRQKIVEFVNRLGTVSFAQLKAAFPEVSEMTLRTDLKALDEERRLVRVHGGAKSVEVVVGTDDFLLRRSLRAAPEKRCV